LLSTAIQLITSSGGQGRVFDDNADDDDYDEDEENSPVVLRQRQEQAYRSVAALQLRVEELTLEVTKVRSVNVIIILYRVCECLCHRFRLTIQDDYFRVSFDHSFFGCSKNWLHPKTKPP